MIQKQTILQLGDNSGARFARCIDVYNPKKMGSINAFILVSIKSVRLKGKIKKGDLLKAIVIRVKYKVTRKTGNFLSCNENTIVLLNKKNELYGTRVFGPISQELRKKNFLKLLALGSVVI
jgi:large subunit ribosomal protein L14